MAVTKVLPFMPPAQRRRERAEQASLWVLRLDAGVSARELSVLQRWLDEDPRHLQVLIEAATLWDRASVLAELAERFPLDRYLAPRPRWLCRLPAALAAVLRLFQRGGHAPRARRGRRI